MPISNCENYFELHPVLEMVSSLSKIIFDWKRARTNLPQKLQDERDLLVPHSFWRTWSENLLGSEEVVLKD